MINIEKKLQHGWGLECFLQEYGCNSEDKLFELLNRDFSRKAAKSYIVRMKINSLKDKDKRIIRLGKVNKQIDSLEEEQIQVQVEMTIEDSAEIESVEQVQKKGWLSKIINYFKKMLK